MRLRLRQVREQQVMTQEELAEKSGVTQATISRLEHGAHDARMSTIRKVAKALGVDLRELIAPEWGNEGNGVRVTTRRNHAANRLTTAATRERGNEYGRAARVRDVQ